MFGNSVSRRNLFANLRYQNVQLCSALCCRENHRQPEKTLAQCSGYDPLNSFSGLYMYMFVLYSYWLLRDWKVNHLVMDIKYYISIQMANNITLIVGLLQYLLFAKRKSLLLSISLLIFFVWNIAMSYTPYLYLSCEVRGNYLSFWCFNVLWECDSSL